VITCT